MKQEAKIHLKLEDSQVERVSKRIPRAVPWFKALPKVRIVCIIWRNFADSFTCKYKQ